MPVLSLYVWAFSGNLKYINLTYVLSEAENEVTGEFLLTFCNRLIESIVKNNYECPENIALDNIKNVYKYIYIYIHIYIYTLK